LSADPTRHSQAREVELITDPDLRAAQEGLNGIKQFDAVVAMVETFLSPDRPFKFRPSHLLHLHREALQGISIYAGTWRPAQIEIGGSKHQPVGAHLVPEMIEEMCDYVNSSWQVESAIHLSAYVMWRLNWIHPFTDGNGRTSRAASYLVLCLKTGYLLPGKLTIPDQISEDRSPYYKALEAADSHLRDTHSIDLREMEELLSTLLARQLYQVMKDAAGDRAIPVI
jgi:Fic family protein